MKAHAVNAIEQLLVTDTLFRSNDIKTRKKYVKLVEDVREAGADVKVSDAPQRMFANVFTICCPLRK